jgi:hypothetical protein
MEYTVRPSRVADHEALIALFGGPKAAANTLQIPYEAPEARLQRLATPPPGHYSLVACTPEGEVVGLLGLTVNQRPRRSHKAPTPARASRSWSSVSRYVRSKARGGWAALKSSFRVNDPACRQTEARRDPGLLGGTALI